MNTFEFLFGDTKDLVMLTPCQNEWGTICKMEQGQIAQKRCHVFHREGESTENNVKRTCNFLQKIDNRFNYDVHILCVCVLQLAVDGDNSYLYIFVEITDP